MPSNIQCLCSWFFRSFFIDFIGHVDDWPWPSSPGYWPLSSRHYDLDLDLEPPSSRPLLSSLSRLSALSRLSSRFTGRPESRLSSRLTGRPESRSSRGERLRLLKIKKIVYLGLKTITKFLTILWFLLDPNG